MAKAADQRDQPKPRSQSANDASASQSAPDIFTNCTRPYTGDLYRELCSFPVPQSRPSPLSPCSWPSAYFTEQYSLSNKAPLYGSGLIEPISPVPTNCGSCRLGGGHGASTSSPTTYLTELKWRVRSHSPELKRRKTGWSLKGGRVPLSPNHSLAERNGFVSATMELETLIGVCTKLSELNIRSEIEGQGRCSMSMSLSPLSPAQEHHSQETEGRGKALGRTGLDDAACNRTESNAISSNHGSNSGGGMSPTISSKAKVEAERRSGPSSPQSALSDLHEKTVSDWWNPTPPNVDDLRSRSLSQWSQMERESTKNVNQKESESDGSGKRSFRVRKSRSRSISPWSQAARDIYKNDSSSKDTGDWGENLTHTGPDVWSQPQFDISQDAVVKKRRRGGWVLRDRSLSPEPKRRTGQDLDRTRGRCDTYLPINNNRHRRSGSYRGDGCADSPEWFQKSGRGMSPTTSSKAKVEAERRSGPSSPQSDLSDLHEKTVSDWWSPTPPNVDDSRSRSLSQWSQMALESTKNVNWKESESDGSGTTSFRVRKSRSRSISPWSQAARDIYMNDSSKDTGDWGKNLTHTGPDVWSQPRFNISQDAVVQKRRRGGWGLRDRSLSPEPKSRTGQDLDRTRGRCDTYLPINNNRHRRSGSYRGCNCADSPEWFQKRSFKRSSRMSSARTNKIEDDKGNLPRSYNLWNQTDCYSGNQSLSQLSPCLCKNRKRGDPAPECKGRTERDPGCSRDTARHRIYSCNNIVELDQWRNRKMHGNPPKAQVGLLWSPMVLECAPVQPNSSECSAVNVVGLILAVPLSDLHQKGANSPKQSTTVLATTLPVPNTVPADSILAKKPAAAGVKRTREGVEKRS